jgi:hypothetical protein
MTTNTEHIYEVSYDYKGERCIAKKANGERCSAPAKAASPFCGKHGKTPIKAQKTSKGE